MGKETQEICHVSLNLSIIMCCWYDLFAWAVFVWQPHASILTLDPALATSCSRVVEMYIFDYLLLRCNSCDFLVWLTILVGRTRKVLLYLIFQLVPFVIFIGGAFADLQICQWPVFRISQHISEPSASHSSFRMIRAAVPLSQMVWNHWRC